MVQAEPFLSPPSRFGDRRNISVGLLGGSFDPAHPGHLRVAQAFLIALRLDQVWLLVSPGNPLKSPAARATRAARLASAQRLSGRRILATDIEARLGTRYTIDTLTALRRRFPRMRFVWLMGADGLANMPRWRHWQRITRLAPIAVHPRPGSNRTALAGRAAHRFAPARWPARQAPILATARAPAWLFLPLAQGSDSSTALRDAGLGVDTAH